MPYRILKLAGKPYRPSNGTEGMLFMSRFCDRCEHEASYRESEESPCDILSRSMIFAVDEEGYPVEWVHDEQGRPECTAFERELTLVERAHRDAERHGQQRLFHG